jgi:DNA-binding IclR family transcriptional regulator
MDAGARVTDAVRRLKGVFTEIPGTRLTVADASRLSGLDRPVCQLLLMALEDAHFLERRRDGLYERPTTDAR